MHESHEYENGSRFIKSVISVVMGAVIRVEIRVVMSVVMIAVMDTMMCVNALYICLLKYMLLSMYLDFFSIFLLWPGRLNNRT
ncbi:hypothetical protein BDB01DRAFT_789478 [Pilobolus umbonatus]|nr:hypothetical protein BDB01DRAFT_789478 [Pilobolus umbonatus]